MQLAAKSKHSCNTPASPIPSDSSLTTINTAQLILQLDTCVGLQLRLLLGAAFPQMLMLQAVFGDTTAPEELAPSASTAAAPERLDVHWELADSVGECSIQLIIWPSVKQSFQALLPAIKCLGEGNKAQRHGMLGICHCPLLCG